MIVAHHSLAAGAYVCAVGAVSHVHDQSERRHDAAARGTPLVAGGRGRGGEGRTVCVVGRGNRCGLWEVSGVS